MTIDPTSIAPELWAAEDASGVTFALVCGKRFGHVAAPIGTKEEIPEGIRSEGFVLAEKIVHPVMIEIMPCPCTVHLGKVLDSNHHWTRSKVALAGLSERAAQAALAEAYLGLRYARLDFATMAIEWKTNVERFRDYKGGTPWRNANICLQWDRWGRNGVSHEERTAQVRQMGFACTSKALSRIAEERGL